MIKIIVDSASDLHLQDGMIDYFVPMTVEIGGREYRCGVDLSNDEFYDLITSTKEFPRTSQPSPQMFAEIFEQVKADGDQLIYIALSSALSGTYQSAVVAKQMVGYDDIYIVDSKTATHLIGILVRYARKCIDDGLTAAQIAEKCEQLKTRIRVFAGVDTLEYLRRGGRLSGASAAVGTLAQVKPILTVTDEGKVDVAAKAIGLNRAMQTIVDRLGQYQLDEEFPIYTLYTCGQENCDKLDVKLESVGVASEARLQVGPAIGAHVGPGLYGVVFVTK